MFFIIGFFFRIIYVFLLLDDLFKYRLGKVDVFDLLVFSFVMWDVLVNESKEYKVFVVLVDFLL